MANKIHYHSCSPIDRALVCMHAWDVSAHLRPYSVVELKGVRGGWEGLDTQHVKKRGRLFIAHMAKLYYRTCPLEI